MLNHFFAALLMAFLAVPHCSIAADDKKPYDELADAKNAIAVAQSLAKAQGKSTLLVFGANWCPDCRVLDLEMNQGELAKRVAQKYVVVKVDVGRFDKNKDITSQYGDVLKKGIPSLVLLRADGSAAYQTNGGELADARKLGRDGIERFFETMPGKDAVGRQ